MNPNHRRRHVAEYFDSIEVPPAFGARDTRRSS